jgi:hypothetical protein
LTTSAAPAETRARDPAKICKASKPLIIYTRRTLSIVEFTLSPRQKNNTGAQGSLMGFLP